MGSHSLLQGIFPPRDQTWDSRISRRILYCLSHQGSLIYPKTFCLSSALFARRWTLLLYSWGFSGRGQAGRFPFTFKGRPSHPQLAPQFSCRMMSSRELFQSFSLVRIPAILLCRLLLGDPTGGRGRPRHFFLVSHCGSHWFWSLMPYLWWWPLPGFKHWLHGKLYTRSQGHHGEPHRDPTSWSLLSTGRKRQQSSTQIWAAMQVSTGVMGAGGALGLVLERQRSSLEDVTSLPPNGDRKNRSSNMIMVRG